MSFYNSVNNRNVVIISTFQIMFHFIQCIKLSTKRDYYCVPLSPPPPLSLFSNHTSLIYFIGWLYVSSRATPFCNIFLTFYSSSSNKYISCLIVLTTLWLIAGTELLVFTIQCILLDPTEFLILLLLDIYMSVLACSMQMYQQNQQSELSNVHVQKKNQKNQ